MVKVAVGAWTFPADLAADDTSRANGLRNYNAPRPMLFDFMSPGRWRMTMHGVRFDLDALAIQSDANDQGIVVGKITMPAFSEGPHILSGTPYRFVLELPAGMGAGIRLGDKVRFLL